MAVSLPDKFVTSLKERLIEITGVPATELFGVNNAHVELMKEHYPKLKIIARGDTLKVFGEPGLIDEFDNALRALQSYIHRYNHLDKASVERILTTGHSEPDMPGVEDLILFGTGGKVIKARTPRQREMLNALEKNDLLFAVGPAGTGKTYTAVAMAVRALKDRQVRRIILTRPAVEAGETLGFLPGDFKEKMDPYMQPLYDALREMIPPQKLSSFIEKGTVQIAPLAYMRGRTLDESFVILDEAQNSTHNQMKMFLTRMGANAKFVITGDPGQVDLPKRQRSGLMEALLALKNVKGVSIIHLDERDVMRHPLVKRILKAYKTIDNN